MASTADPAQVFRAVSDPHRRRILDLLRGGEQAVLELLQHFSFSQPALSKHLGILRAAGLVAVDRRGKQRIYSLRADGLREVYDWCGHYAAFWDERLDRLGTVLEELP